jgi:tRNA pseudouridine13 synthase
MFGATMRRPEALAEERERALFDRSGVTYEMLQRFTKLGEGTRRPARVRLSECRVERDGDALQLAFELPAGAYATTVLREVMKSEPA